METLKHFSDFVNEIQQNNSRKYKLEVLSKYANDAIVRYYLHFIFDPFIRTGISDKKLDKQLVSKNREHFAFDGVFDLLEHLKTHNTGTDRDVEFCQIVLHMVDEDMRDILRGIITKNLPMGIDASTINKCIPNLISTFNVMLANKYFEKPEYVEGKTFTLTTKIDGGRIIAIKKNGDVKFYTRAGQLYEGLVDLEDTLKSDIFPDNICFDGEITLLNPGNLTSKEQYKATMKIVRKDGEKHGVKMRVFDMMPADDFINQVSTYTYQMRRAALETLFLAVRTPYFTILDNLYTGTDTTQIERILNEQLANGEEGIMINVSDAPYEFKRTNNLLKVKKFQSCDLRIMSLEEGTGKNAGRLGAFICSYKGGQVKVGSGLDDATRELVWSNPDAYIGTIIEVGYFEETSNANGGLSLRFPTFKDFRPDKTEADF